MERFAPDLAFDLPSPNLNFDTFSAFPLPVASGKHNVSVDSIATENFLRKLSEKIGRGLSSAAGGSDNPLNLIRNQVVLNGTGVSLSDDGSGEFPNEDWIRQAEYDKFMNEIWIGIVLTLIVISMVFCICSCFLYHQFRQWKNNYHRNIQQSNDIESVKLSIDDDDLPSYTLVSGLPSYDAALEQLQRSSASNSCLLMYPSVFKIFTTNEKQDVFPGSVVSSSNEANSTTSSPHQYHTVVAVVPSYQEATSKSSEAKCDEAAAPSYQEALLPSNLRSTS